MENKVAKCFIAEKLIAKANYIYFFYLHASSILIWLFALLIIAVWINCFEFCHKIRVNFCSTNRKPKEMHASFQIQLQHLSDMSLCVLVCLFWIFVTCSREKSSTNPIRNWQENKVIHESSHLISLHDLVAVHLWYPLMHTCAMMFKGLVFTLSSERNSHHHFIHTRKAQFTNMSWEHTFIFFNFFYGLSVTCWWISTFAL